MSVTHPWNHGVWFKKCTARTLAPAQGSPSLGVWTLPLGCLATPSAALTISRYKGLRLWGKFLGLYDNHTVGRCLSFEAPQPFQGALSPNAKDARGCLSSLTPDRAQELNFSC